MGEVARTARPKCKADSPLKSPHGTGNTKAASLRLTEGALKAFTAATTPATNGGEGLLLGDRELRSVSPISTPGVGTAVKKKKRRRTRPDAGSEDEDVGRRQKKRKMEAQRDASLSPRGEGRVQLTRR